MRSVGFGVVLALAGCAWGAGGGFSKVQGRTLTVKLDLLAGSLDSTGCWLTNNGYGLLLAQSGLFSQDAKFSMIGTSVGGGATAFDDRGVQYTVDPKVGTHDLDMGPATNAAVPVVLENGEV